MCPSSMCQLMRQMDMSYTASCSASCADTCVNASQTNCSVNCCNSTGCLSGTFASMMMTTTTGKHTSSTSLTSPFHDSHNCSIYFNILTLSLQMIKYCPMTACLRACTFRIKFAISFIFCTFPYMILATTTATTKIPPVPTTTAMSPQTTANNVRTKGCMCECVLACEWMHVCEQKGGELCVSLNSVHSVSSWSPCLRQS